jgi:hypothetical protein
METVDCEQEKIMDTERCCKGERKEKAHSEEREATSEAFHVEEQVKKARQKSCQSVGEGPSEWPVGL